MGKSRMMGAGRACSTIYKSNVNIPTGGGTKKQGFGAIIGENSWTHNKTRRRANGLGRFRLIFVNQLSGVKRQYINLDGVHSKV